jgi:hypothetical protein
MEYGPFHAHPPTVSRIQDVGIARIDYWRIQLLIRKKALGFVLTTGNAIFTTGTSSYIDTMFR